jgi:hypothetical protein
MCPMPPHQASSCCNKMQTRPPPLLLWWIPRHNWEGNICWHSYRLPFTDRLSHTYLRSPHPLSRAHLRSPAPCAPNGSCHDISPPCHISVCFCWEEREASMARSLPAAATDTRPLWQQMLIHCPVPLTRLLARTSVHALHCTLPFHPHCHRWRRRQDTVCRWVGKGIR